MKTILISLSFLVFTNVYSQVYHPLLADSMTWYIAETFEGTYTQTYYSVNDINFNSFTYKITPWGLIREDTISKKVYLRQDTTTNEILLYDFSLQEGDSIYLGQYSYCTSWGSYWKVDSIRNTNILAGQRKKWYFHNCDEPFIYTMYWIEEVGSPTRIDDNAVLCTFGSQLNCLFKNTDHIYQSETSQILGCTYTLNINENIEPNFKIFPNPITDNLTIDLNSIAPCYIELYNILAQKVEYFSFSNNSKINLDLTSTPTGIYFLRIKQGDLIETMKVIKN